MLVLTHQFKDEERWMRSVSVFNDTIHIDENSKGPDKLMNQTLVQYSILKATIL